MLALIAALSAQGLTPIALDNPDLWAAETFVSPAAAQVISEGETPEIDCLSLSDSSSGYERICLAENEWDELFGEVAEREGLTASLSNAALIADLNFSLQKEPDFSDPVILPTPENLAAEQP